MFIKFKNKKGQEKWDKKKRKGKERFQARFFNENDILFSNSVNTNASNWPCKTNEM